MRREYDEVRDAYGSGTGIEGQMEGGSGRLLKCEEGMEEGMV